MCWKNYIQDFIKLEFHNYCFGDQIVNALAQYFYSLCESEPNIFFRFIKLHARASVNYLNIVRCLPMFLHLPDHSIERFFKQEEMLKSLSDSDHFFSFFIDTLFSIISELFSNSSDDSNQELNTWHDRFLQSVSINSKVRNLIKIVLKI